VIIALTTWGDRGRPEGAPICMKHPLRRRNPHPPSLLDLWRCGGGRSGRPRRGPEKCRADQGLSRTARRVFSVSARAAPLACRPCRIRMPPKTGSAPSVQPKTTRRPDLASRHEKGLWLASHRSPSRHAMLATWVSRSQPAAPSTTTTASDVERLQHGGAAPPERGGQAAQPHSR